MRISLHVMTCLQEEFEALDVIESGSEMEFGRGEGDGDGDENLPTAEVTECNTLCTSILFVNAHKTLLVIDGCAKLWLCVLVDCSLHSQSGTESHAR